MPLFRLKRIGFYFYAFSCSGAVHSKIKPQSQPRAANTFLSIILAPRRGAHKPSLGLGTQTSYSRGSPLNFLSEPCPNCEWPLLPWKQHLMERGIHFWAREKKTELSWEAGSRPPVLRHCREVRNLGVKGEGGSCLRAYCEMTSWGKDCRGASAGHPWEGTSARLPVIKQQPAPEKTVLPPHLPRPWELARRLLPAASGYPPVPWRLPLMERWCRAFPEDRQSVVVVAREPSNEGRTSGSGRRSSGTARQQSPLRGGNVSAPQHRCLRVASQTQSPARGQIGGGKTQQINKHALRAEEWIADNAWH